MSLGERTSGPRRCYIETWSAWMSKNRSARTQLTVWFSYVAATNHAILSHGGSELRCPTLVVSGGPMLNGHYRGQALGRERQFGALMRS